MADTGGFGPEEARGIQGCLISAQSLQQVPGRTSDVLDCQWIPTLHSDLIITHNFCELRERYKGQVVDNKKGVADNTL